MFKWTYPFNIGIYMIVGASNYETKHPHMNYNKLRISLEYKINVAFFLLQLDKPLNQIDTAKRLVVL
jgi:hypothetical protein